MATATRSRPLKRAIISNICVTIAALYQISRQLVLRVCFYVDCKLRSVSAVGTATTILATVCCSQLYEVFSLFCFDKWNMVFRLLQHAVLT
jgi:hypothetical protein